MALYQDTQMYWNRDFKVLGPLPRPRERGLREHVVLGGHFGWWRWRRRAEPRQLDQSPRRGRLPDRHHDARPRATEYYLSYRWGSPTAARTRRASSSGWSVPNLQSVTMMQSMAAMAAEYHVPVQDALQQPPLSAGPTRPRSAHRVPGRVRAVGTISARRVAPDAA